MDASDTVVENVNQNGERTNAPIIDSLLQSTSDNMSQENLGIDNFDIDKWLDSLNEF